MTDNRTTELLKDLLLELMDEYAMDDFTSQTKFAKKYAERIEQAIAATLGSERHPYEQRITGDGSDWGEIMIDAYDDLMAAACESCTPEQMRQLADHISAELWSGTCEMMTSGTLTAEQVRKVLLYHLPHREYYSVEQTDAWQAIADELNAEIGGTCKLEPLSALDVTLNMLDQTEWGACSECGCAVPMHSRFCNECGKAVKR